MSTVNNRLETAKSDVAVDTREALFNGGEIGSFQQFQVSTECIVSVRGILFDLDPDIYLTGSLLPNVPKDPADFYAAVTRPMLDRHPVLRKCQVRISGRGLHAILRFGEPIEFKSEGERTHWTGVIEVVQAALAVDPDAPGVTATTRPLGSINSKNGARVTLLAQGEPVTADEVLELYDEMIEAPFRTVLKIMTGDTAVEPCPFCGKAGTKLSALDYAGRCYGVCGNVKLERLYDLVLAPRASGKEVATNA